MDFVTKPSSMPASATSWSVGRVHPRCRLRGNPARVIPLFQGFIDQHNATSAGLRGICETVWADRRPEELVECRRSELLLNEAFGDAADFWLLFPYDSSALGRLVIDDAYVTHQFIDRAGQTQDSASCIKRRPSPRRRCPRFTAR